MRVFYVQLTKFVMNNRQDLSVLVQEIKWEHFVNMVRFWFVKILKIFHHHTFFFFLDNPCTLLASTYCSNGGTCITTNTDPPIASCLCRDGFTGSRCTSTSLNDPCASTPCQGRGVCALSTVNTSYACVCQANFIGDQCERCKHHLNWSCINWFIFHS